MLYVSQLSPEPGIDMGYSTFLVVEADPNIIPDLYDELDLRALMAALDTQDPEELSAALEQLQGVEGVSRVELADYAFLDTDPEESVEFPMNCMDCGVETGDEYYSLHDELWCSAVLSGEDLAEALRLLARLNNMSNNATTASTSWHAEHDSVVRKYCALVEGFLCIGCLETRLGRRVVPEDFSDAPVNWPSEHKSPRLYSRLTGEPEAAQ